jgi:4-hydroxybenzoyl-CoA thioesterase
MRAYQRAVRFEEVDAAGIVYFAQIVSYAHEAMEELFSELEGGYAGLIMQRRVGLPAVKLTSEFSAPLRYGDTMRIETAVSRLGGKSADLDYAIYRVADDTLCATLRHTVVVTDLAAMRSCAMPADVRELLQRHLSG